MDLRAHVGAKLKHHRVVEGGCYHDHHYYMCFGNMSKGTTVIVKFHTGAEKEIVKVSKVLNVGHANDCCARGGVLYITHSGSSNRIHRVDADTLEKLQDVVVTGCKGGFNGITCFGTGYMVKKMSCRKVYVLDNKFRYKSTVTLSKTYKVGQGMHWDRGTKRLYRAASNGQSTKNYVAAYSAKGKLKKVWRYKSKCELEDVMVVGDKLKISVYKKHKVKGKKKFEAFIRTLAEL
jgi:hypothetical protein